MRINGIANTNINKKTNKPQTKSFGSVNEIVLQKCLFRFDCSERGALKYFKDCLRHSQAKKEGPVKSVLLNIFGVRPKPLAFINYPGYSHIQKYMDNGSTWVARRIDVKYNNAPDRRKLNIVLPDLNHHKYSLYLLTRGDSLKFREYREHGFEELERTFESEVRRIEKDCGRSMDVEDKTMFKDLMKALYELKAFRAVKRESGMTSVELDFSNELYDVVPKCL